MDYTLWQIAVVLFAYGIAAVGKGITGLGFSTTCLPILTLTLGLKEALPLVILPSISSNLVVMVEAGRFRETLSRFWPMLLATIPGLLIGLWALSGIDGVLAGGVLGGILVAWCLFSLARPDLRLPTGLERPIGPVSGFLTGLVNGVTGSQVMPAVPFLMMLRMERPLFVQAVNCSFTMSSVIMAVGLTKLGLFSTGALILSLTGLGIVYVGVRLGAHIGARLDPDRLRIAILCMLIAMSLSLILRAL